MGEECTFYLEGSDTVAAALDYVVGTADKPVVALFVAPRHVAGVVDAVVPGFLGFLGIAVIAFE